MKNMLYRVLILLLSASNLYASETVTVLPDVKLKAKRPAQVDPIEEIQISRKTIAESPVVTFTELLSQQQSMVRVTDSSADNSQSALSLRGFGDNAAANSLILIDGFPLTNVSLITPNLNSIAIADIERIDIIQGSRGVLWGDQAVGGVVNIVTRHPNHLLAEGGAGVGNYRYRSGYIFAANQLPNGLQLKIIGQRIEGDQYRHHNQFTNELLSLNTKYDYANGSLQFRYNTTNQSIELPGKLTYAQYHQAPRQATNFTNATHTRTQTTQLWHSHAWSNNWLLETRLSHQDLWSDGFVFSAFDRHEAENRLSPRLKGRINKHELTLGGELLNSQYRFLNKFADESFRQNQQHIFIHDKIELTKTLAMTLGLRKAWENTAGRIYQHSHADAQNIAVSEQGLIYQPLEPWKFYIRRDGNFRFPKVTEMTWGSQNGSELLAQTGVSYETGFVYENLSHKLGLNLYDLRIKNEIGFNPSETPGKPFGSYQNLDPTERRGISIWGAQSLNDSLILDAEINYVNARFVQGPYAQAQIPAVPCYTGNIGLSKTFATNWRLRYSLNVTGPRFPSQDFANQSKPLPSYGLHYLSLQYFNRFTQISFEIKNLLNQRYPTYVMYNPIQNTNTYYSGLGRAYLLSMKIFID